MSESYRKTVIIIPAYNEEEIIVPCIEQLPKDLDILVVNNGSTDETANRVRSTRAHLLHESRMGYGQAIWSGIIEGIRLGYTYGIVFDADASNDPNDIHTILEPIWKGTHDLTLAQRTKHAEPGSLTPQQIFGNALSVKIIRIITGYTYSDLGSMRAFDLRRLRALQLEDRDYGWNIEMQIKAVRAGWRILEFELPYRNRLGGASKISGSMQGSIKAGIKILATAARYAR
ncbi:MAG: glycosyltransferase family 2 protein [Myxococcota bacterium]|nr:glycosyltransferase family 2 protein [Myxococcota bacterium]